MSERKRNLGIAWSVWIETVTQALTRAREDRLGCRIDVPARGGDAVCELLDGAEVIGRYVAMGVQVGLPLGEAKAEPSRGRVRYGFRPADLAVLTDDELARLDDLFPGGFVQARLPRTDPAVWWHTRSTEPSEATAAFLVWTISRLPGGVPVANDDPDDQRRIDAAREVAFAPSTTNLVNLFRWPSAPTGFQHATAETPQEPAPVETATSGGYQAAAEAATRAPVGDPASALGELLAAAEGTLLPHAQGPVTVRSLRPVADLRAEDAPETAPAADVPDGETKRWRYGISHHTLAKLPREALDALARIHPTPYAWTDLNGGGSPAWWMVYPLDGSMGSTTAPAFYDFGAAHKVSYLTRQDTAKDRAQLAALPHVTLAEAAVTSAEMMSATKAPAKDAATKRKPEKTAPAKKTAPTSRDPKPENVSKKPAKGDVVRVIVTPDDEDLGGLKGVRWLDLARGLPGWNPMKTPHAGGVSGGTCRPLALHAAPPGLDVKRLLALLHTKKIPFLDFGDVPKSKQFDFAPSLRSIRAQWNDAHPKHPVALGGTTWAKPEKPALNLAVPLTAEDVQRAKELESAVREGFVRPVIAREAWEKLSDEARGAFAVFRLGSGSHVRTSWGPTKDGKGVEPLLPPLGRQSEIALNLEEIAAELGVTLTFEPHPVMGSPAPDATPSSGAPGDAPAAPTAPAKLHRQTPEPAADKRAGRGRHTILAQDASGLWTFKRERRGEAAPAWMEIARELAASGRRVRVYDGKPRCTWDSLDEPAVPFEQPDPEPTAEPPATVASPEPGDDASPSAATDAPGTVRVWIAEDQWEALHPDDRTAFEHPDVDVEPVWEGGYQHVATTVDARGLAALQGLITARELDVTLREDAAPVAPAEVTLYLAAATWEGMDEAMRAEFGNAAGRAYAAYRDGVSPWRTFGPMPRASADRMLAKGRELALRLYDVEPGTGTAYRDAAHAFDARVTGKGAGLALTDQNHGTHFLGRKAKQTDADWTRDVGEIVSGASGLEVMRLYDRKGRCTWDSRDGGPVTLGGPAATGAPAVTLADRNLRVLWRANHHPTDTVVATSYPNRAALAIETETGTQYVERPPKLSEATWKQKARDTIAATAGVKVARLYSQKAKCLWDSRDGKAIG